MSLPGPGSTPPLSTWRVVCDLCRREISLPSSDGSLVEAKRVQLVHMLDHGEMSKRMMSIVRREEVPLP